MSRIFITGSSDGLGLMAANLLIAGGHQVVLHGRNEKRSQDALIAAPGAETVLTGDLSTIAETVKLAENVNRLGHFDAVIHNAAIGYREQGRNGTTDDLPAVFAINSLAPYILTCLIRKPKRLIYLSSGLNKQGDASLDDLEWKKKRWNGSQAYSDSKLHNLMLSFAVARKWPDVFSNALEPGWVATKMGGAGAPDSLKEGPETQVWLAVSSDRDAQVSGKYFFHKKLHRFNEAASDINLQDKLLDAYHRISGLNLPS
jgi:NAD(P)-dependent dehydrogenase (short-subunit alcohol dehydrogenase family)